MNIVKAVKPNDPALKGKKSVRLIGQNNEQVGVVTVFEAFQKANEAGVDLVLIAPQATPPVCRLMDFGKFQYDQSKKQRIQKKKQHTQKVKEVKFHPNIDEHDFQTKLNHSIAFLEKGYKVKVSMFLRGREMAHADIGVEVMERVAVGISKYGTAEKPNRAGRVITLMLSPGTSKSSANSEPKNG